MKLFARQLPVIQKLPDLDRFRDTPRQKIDPCFHCSLPFDCDPKEPECKFVNTSFHGKSTRMAKERQELLEELIEEGAIISIRGNGFIEYPGMESAEERQRKSKRDYMRRKRAK